MRGKRIFAGLLAIVILMSMSAVDAAAYVYDDHERAVTNALWELHWTDLEESTMYYDYTHTTIDKVSDDPFAATLYAQAAYVVATTSENYIESIDPDNKDDIEELNSRYWTTQNDADAGLRFIYSYALDGYEDGWFYTIYGNSEDDCMYFEFVDGGTYFNMVTQSDVVVGQYDKVYLYDTDTDTDMINNISEPVTAVYSSINESGTASVEIDENTPASTTSIAPSEQSSESSSSVSVTTDTDTGETYSGTSAQTEDGDNTAVTPETVSAVDAANTSSEVSSGESSESIADGKENSSGSVVAVVAVATVAVAAGVAAVVLWRRKKKKSE